MSNTPPAWVVKAALPPVLDWENCVVPPALVMTVALPAVLEFVNSVLPPLLAMRVALPAVLEVANDVLPPRLAVMVALPAVVVLLKVVNPRKLAVRVALPAVLDPRKLAKPPLPLVMVALPAVLVSLKLVKPLLVLVMVALAAVLELKNCVTELLPLLVMIALLAVLLLVNANSEVNGKEKVGAFEELLTSAGKGQAARRGKTERIGRRSGIEGKSAEAVPGNWVERQAGDGRRPEERGAGRHGSRRPIGGGIEIRTARSRRPGRILGASRHGREQCRGRSRRQQISAHRAAPAAGNEEQRASRVRTAAGGPPKVARTMSRLAPKAIANHRSVPPPSEDRTHAARGKRKLGAAPTFGRNLTRVAKTSQSSTSLPRTAGRGRRPSRRARSEALEP